jgi:DNA-binding IclR family transcriptional regulator
MPGPRSMRLVESALRCYPQLWRTRHGDEAAEIASLLIRDGTPAHSIAWSYLMGAARTRLVIGPRRRLGAAVGALLLAAGSLGVPLALLSSSAPANAASVAHSRTAHPHPAHPHPAHPRPGDSRPADPRYGRGRGAPDRCDRHDHC